jgi:hypothetical protein
MGETWEAANARYTQSQARLQYRVTNDVNISALKTAITSCATGGQADQAKLETIANGLTKLEAIHKDYAALNDAIITEIKNRATASNMSTLVTTNGALQNSITSYQKQKKDKRVDVESALAREELLRSQTRDITSHQLFILDRPIRKGMIPYLWVLSVVFVGIALILFRMAFPVFTITALDATLFFRDITSNSTIWIALLICALIVILFLSLKVAGVFGK